MSTWTTTAISPVDGNRQAHDAPTKKAALRTFVELVKVGTTCELRSPAGHVHNAYRAETGPVVVEADGSYVAAE